MKAELSRKTVFSLLYTRFYKRVRSYVISLGADEDTAEEIAQDTFIRFYRKLDCNDPERPGIQSYLFTTARNLFVDHIRRDIVGEEKHRQYYFEEIELNESFFKSLDDSYISGQIISTVNDTIDTFSPPEREIILKKYLHEHSVRKISLSSGIPAYRIRKIEQELHRFFQDIRKLAS